MRRRRRFQGLSWLYKEVIRSSRQFQSNGLGGEELCETATIEALDDRAEVFCKNTDSMDSGT